MTSEGPLSAQGIFKGLAEKLSDRQRSESDLTPYLKWRMRFSECVNERGVVVDKEKWGELKAKLYLLLGQVPGEACYIPGATQTEAHRAEETTKQVAGGWRAGKSKWLAAELLPYMFIEKAHIWLVANTYELGRAEFGYIKEWLAWMQAPFYKDAKPQQGRWSIGVAGGGLLDTQTADDVTKLEMVNLNAVGIAEAGQVYHEIFLRLKGRVMEKAGPIFLSGSFESSLIWYLKEFEAHLNGGDDWHSWAIPSWENAVIFPLGRQDPKILKQERELPEELFKLKIAAQVVRPPELVYPQFDPKKNVTPLYFAEQDLGEIEQMLSKKFEGGYHSQEPYPVFSHDGNIRAWILPEPKPGDIEITVDPGFNPGAYAVLAMYKLDPYVFQIDEIYKHQMVHEAVINETRNRWWFRYVNRGTIDNAGGQHHADRSAKEVWASPYAAGGAALNLESQKITIQDGMQRTRTMLEDPMTKKPKLFFSPDCKSTIREFDLYRYPPGREMGSQRDVPIDRDNHCVVGDTMIDLPGGQRKISDLVGQEPLVYCHIDGRVAVRKATNIHKTRENAEVVKILMDKGELICTPDHLVMLKNGSYLEAGKLRPGVSLMAFNRYVTYEGYTRVCMTGQTRNTEAEHRLVYKEVYGLIPADFHIDHVDGNAWNHHPDNLQALSMEEHASKHHKGKVLSASHLQRIAEVARERWANDDGSWRMKVIENGKLAHEANRGHAPWNKGMKKPVGENHRVIAVIPCGTADVYDMNVEEAHNFVANGIVIHNSMKALGYWLVRRMGIVGAGRSRVISKKYIHTTNTRWFEDQGMDPYENGI